MFILVFDEELKTLLGKEKWHRIKSNTNFLNEEVYMYIVRDQNLLEDIDDRKYIITNKVTI